MGSISLIKIIFNVGIDGATLSILSIIIVSSGLVFKKKEILLEQFNAMPPPLKPRVFDKLKFEK